MIEINDPYISLPVGISAEIVDVDDQGRIYVKMEGERIITLDYFKDTFIKYDSQVSEG